jgi:hypothetical protein
VSVTGSEPSVTENDSGLLVKSDAAKRQLEEEIKARGDATTATEQTEEQKEDAKAGKPLAAPKRFHGTVELDPERVGRDASQIADEVIAHLTGLVGSDVKVTLEIDATIEGGAPEDVVRTVTENSKTLKFKQHGFEKE